MRMAPRGVRRIGGGRHFDPHRRVVGAAQAQQVVGDRAGARQPIEERGAGLRIGEARRRRTAARRARASRAGSRASASDADWRRAWSWSPRPTRPMYTPSCTASKSRAKAAARSSPTRLSASSAGTGGVGVLVRCCGVHFRSMAARMLAASAPELYSCIDSRATSTQIAQPKPCVSHSRDVAGGVARADEAVLVVAMAVGLAAAVARHVARHLGMPGGELVDRARDRQRPRQRVAGGVQRRQRRLRGGRRGGLGGRLGRCGLPRHQHAHGRHRQRDGGDSDSEAVRHAATLAGRAAADAPVSRHQASARPRVSGIQIQRAAATRNAAAATESATSNPCVVASDPTTNGASALAIRPML